tara:strand:+ start:16469 stop:16579 length:111 start_codon:yes stop_codon:yes gene_type:complete
MPSSPFPRKFPGLFERFTEVYIEYINQKKSNKDYEI